MTGPGGVVLEDDAHLDQFKQWAQVAQPEKHSCMLGMTSLTTTLVDT